MDGGWLTGILVLAAFSLNVSAEGTSGTEPERWSRPATPERRQGDWVPLTCANCRAIGDQRVQPSNSLPSVLTPPPRLEEARLLPPPPPPDGLFQQAATGFLQAYTQQQRKPQQFLQETTAQSINRPQAQFLSSNNVPLNPKPAQQFLQEPSTDFQPPQQPSNQPLNRQPQLLPFNQQQFISDNGPYLNQPLFLGPQFLAAPFFPQSSIPPQGIQPVNPIPVQPQTPISPNIVPVNKQNLQVPVDRPVFTQQITTGTQVLQNAPQPVITQTSAPQQQYSLNTTDHQRDQGEREEVQLLYVPVETLNQRARNHGRPKSLPSNQQDVASQVVGTESNRFTSPGHSVEAFNRKPHLENQANFNIQTQSKPQYNIKHNIPHHEQPPPEDQDRFNTQTHSVRQQFTVIPNEQLQQHPLRNTDEFKFNGQNLKEQYNVKTNDQYQQDQGDVQLQIKTPQNSQFQQLPPLENQQNFQIQPHNNVQQNIPLNEHHHQQSPHGQLNFNTETFSNNQQFTTQQNIQLQQQLPPVQQNIRVPAATQQFDTNVHSQFQNQQQLNQPSLATNNGQPYINEPLQVNDNQVQIKQQLPLIQQTQPQQQFDQPESHQHTAAPVTTVPDMFTTQQIKTQRFRNNQQHSLGNAQQIQNNQFVRQFPQDYQQTSTTIKPNFPASQSGNIQTRNQNFRQTQQQTWTNQQIQGQQLFDKQPVDQFRTDPQHVSSVAPPFSSSLPPPQTTQAPNQPPLSVYMETTEDTKVNDVLRLLKNAKTIQVLDTVGPESPQVFVGPSNLKAPAGYIKFELPYLNSLESNRVERKVERLPFFVAPLNFNPPPGYSKIPFPAPHVGSVVVSNVTVLKTALHDKPYIDEPVTVSSTEQYLDQFTLPAQIAPISPQLPSLINSLQDEIYSGSSTPAFPSTTPETTTVYTTPTYRGRGSSRGSYRASSNYQTTPSPTRRPQSRTRRPYDGRPYSRRQPVTTTTTVEPSTETPVQHQQFTVQPEQVAFNSDAYSVQNTATPIQTTGEEQFKFQQNNPGTYYNEQFVANSFNRNQFAPQQQNPSQTLENQNFQQDTAISPIPNTEQYHQNQEVTQNSYGIEGAHTSTVPTVAIPDVQREEQTFKSQRTGGSRRDSNRQHQRFRGRQRLTTTTTENYVEPEQPVEHPQQVDTNTNYQNTPSRHRLRNYNQHRLVESTHFETNVPENNFNIQTERADVGLQTTERLAPADKFIQQKSNDNFGNQYQKQTPTQNPEQDIYSTNQNQFQNPQVIFLQPNTNQHEQNFNVSNLQNEFNINSGQNAQSHYTVNQFDQVPNLREPVHQPPQEPQTNIHQAPSDQATFNNQVPAQINQNYFQQNQQRQPTIQEQNQPHSQQQYSNEQVQQLPQETFKDTINPNHQSQQIPNLNQFEQVSEVTASIPQDTPVQSSPSPQNQVEGETQVQQYNQQRLVKYNRHHGKFPVTPDSSYVEGQTSKPRREQYEAVAENQDPSTTEEAITKASLVRVRGRVRSRQRGSTRNYQTTTTESPNYPTTYLNRQRNYHDREENQDYSPRKRVNFSSRQTYSSARDNNYKEVIPEQSATEQTFSIDKQTTAGRFPEYTDATTTTTSEVPTIKSTRKYQHILNRNKVRRTRPTGSPATSGSTKFLVPTTPPPVTRLSNTRGRIRKPGHTTTSTSTTEYPQGNSNWNERDSFAPSAGSNEILEPLYQTRDKLQPSFGFHHSPTPSVVRQKPSPKPSAASEDEDFWNQAVTIQQSTSFDFKPEVTPVTPPSFDANEGKFQGTFSPIWNGQIELQDGNYYDVYNQQQISKSDNDQTPFSSDNQKVVYKDIKSRLPIGKENQYTEKTYEVKRPSAVEEEETLPTERMYPVYRELIKPAESIQEETSQVVVSPYETEGKIVHEKDFVEQADNVKSVPSEEIVNLESGNGVKEGALKRKIFATNPGKKGGRRRGSWVRVRVRKPQDMFETAESQNLASLSENAIPAVTKTLSDKGVWTPDPSTEQPATTTTTTTTMEATTEPSQTINFEQALKEMLKEFITNPEEENKEEGETEANTSDPSINDSTNSTVQSQPKEEESKKTIDSNVERQPLEDETTTQFENESNQKNDNEEKESNKDEEQIKTVTPDVTSEIFTQEPTTIFQPIDSADTTIDPEVTTSPNEQVYRSPNSRILGTSTTTEISLETEICYRGRCVKTKKSDTGSDSDLMPTE